MMEMYEINRILFSVSVLFDRIGQRRVVSYRVVCPDLAWLGLAWICIRILFLLPASDPSIGLP